MAAAAADSATKKPVKVTLYNNPICPFAQRAVLTLLEKKVPYEEVLIPLGGELMMTKSGKDPMPHWKGKTHADLVAIKDDYKKNINSTGEVPTIKNGDDIVAESDVSSEYIDDCFPDSGIPLFPKDPAQRARIRHTMKDMNPGCVYGLLRNQDPAKDEELLGKLYAFLAKFAERASKEGPFFVGSEPSFVDLMWMPFYFRFNLLLPHYRKAEFIPSDAKAYPWAPRMKRWAAAVEARESFKKSSPPAEVIIRVYTGYAGERGVSAAFGK